MDYTKKMALVPQNMMEALMNQQHLVNTPAPILSQLDTEMKVLLDDHRIPADLKAKQYNQILGRYLGIRASEMEPRTAVPPAALEPLHKLNEQAIIKPLPSQSVNKARTLLEHMKDNHKIGWNEKNELIISGRLIPKSNVTDLVHQFSKPGKSGQVGVAGWREFGEALLSGNVPRSAILNQHLWSQIELPYEEDDFSPETPTRASAKAVTPVRTPRKSPTRRQRKRQAPPRFGDWEQY